MLKSVVFCCRRRLLPSVPFSAPCPLGNQAFLGTLRSVFDLRTEFYYPCRSHSLYNSGGVGVFHAEGRGPKSLVCPSKLRENKLISRGIRRDKLNGTNGADFAVFRRFSLTFADFRFSWELQHFGGADFRRKPQIFAETRLSHLVFNFSFLHKIGISQDFCQGIPGAPEMFEKM